MKLLLFALLVSGIMPYALNYKDYLSPISKQLNLLDKSIPKERELQGHAKKTHPESSNIQRKKESHQSNKKKAGVSNRNLKAKVSLRKSNPAKHKSEKRRLQSDSEHHRHKRRSLSVNESHRQTLDDTGNPLSSVLDPISEHLNKVPNMIGIQQAKDQSEKYLSALGTALLGYGAYNYHARSRDFEAFRRKLFNNYMNREMYLDAVSTQIAQMHEVQMALNRCKNKARQVQDAFNNLVLENIKPGFALH